MKSPLNLEPAVNDDYEDDILDDLKVGPSRQEPGAKSDLPPGLYTGNAGAEKVAALGRDEAAARTKRASRADRTEGHQGGGTIELTEPAGYHKGAKSHNQGAVPRKETFLMVPMGLLRRKDLSIGAKLVYAYLRNIDRLSRLPVTGSGVVSPTQVTVAKAIGVSRKSVGKYSSELEQAKLITRQRRGQGRSTIYKVLRSSK